ncbi:hypothetical protein [Cryobacterium ruanii]|uniref:Type II secretion system protein M n=1 Tax=Cryobacterium ruanii TaxID=1259197 RepID=A0A4R9AP98_9MICO|nr:hypothetical protein [Cryobacterium ruanii]TFD66910.1 hypothetical protein E3T47_07040 [Cryobacterium ruanii]
MLVLIIGASVVFGGLLGIAPKLEEIQAATTQREAVLAQNSKHEADLIVLKRDFAGIAELRSHLATLQTAVPVDAGIPEFLDELEVIARQNGIVLKSLTVSDAVAYQPAAQPAAGTDALADTGTAAAADASAASAQSSSLTPENYLAVSVSMSLAGAHSNLFDFVAGLQGGQRSIAISTLATDTGDGSVENEMTILGTIYVLVDAPSVTLPG